jgi:predicted DNA-binding protein (MmcQ/YjbR family)
MSRDGNWLRGSVRRVVDVADVPPEILTRLRSVCLELPETYEEPAWVGIRWRVRKRTFAHVYTVDREWPPVYARAVGAGGPTSVMTFRAVPEELDALCEEGPPFFRAPWGANVMGMILDGDVDWEEVRELLTESYCLLAPKKLAGLIDRPAGS